MTDCLWAYLLACAVVHVSGEPCQPAEFECLTGECVSEKYVCDFSPDCSDGSDERNCTHAERCDFEEGVCDFQASDPANIWTRGSCLADPGPPLDHFGNPTGHYLYLNSKNEEDATAEISSLSFLPTEACTVTFYHHIGQVSGELQVLAESKLGEQLQLWIETRQNSIQVTKPWVRSSVTFRHSQEFRVIFRGLVLGNSDPNEVIAFDDLSFSQSCVLAEARLQHSPNHSQFDCGAGVCVDMKKVCDFTPDCPNGEDEASCPTQCDFETDSCGWHEFVSGDGFEWVRSTPREDSSEQHPPIDHSTNTSIGHFMFVLKIINSFSQRAILQSPTFQQAGPDCTLTFWHYNAGMSVGAATMNLLVEGMENMTILWRTLYHQGNYWQPVTVQLGRQTSPFQISVSKLSLGVYDGISALDDIAFNNCSLPVAMDRCSPDQFHCGLSRACVDRLKLCDLVDDCGDGTDEENCSPELMCSFEDGLCNWTQDKEGDIFDWAWMQGPTPTPNTGPSKDHTWSNVDGHYLYIESSSPQKFKDTAVLISQPFQPTYSSAQDSRPPCVFRLHYHMLGQCIFRLAVYIRYHNEGQGQSLWACYGDQGNLWHRKTLYINSDQPFQILVVGTVGDDFTGDIAIDDLSFLDCEPYDGTLPMETSTMAPPSTLPTGLPHSCPHGQFVCAVYGECVSQNQVCDFRWDCSDGSDEEACVMERCDFEGGALCGWILESPAPPVPLHAFQWLRGKGKTIHPGEKYHRPVNDHTLGTAEGWYVYADSSNGEYGHISYLITPPITATGPMCSMGFWYYMSGFTVGTLQVFIKSGNVTDEMWSETGNQGSSWMYGNVFIGIRYNFQMILHATRGVSYMGDVVVDDIEFINCTPSIILGLPCRKDEFACANGLCIPQRNLCDFADHCGDGSDENHYICKGFSGRCNFEFDLCSWQQLKSDNYDWLIRAGKTPTLGTGPATDHTLRNSSGHYLYLESSFPKVSGETARITGLQFSHRSRECKMVFNLHMSGKGIGTLNVYIITKFSHTLLLNLTGQQGNYWIRQEVPLISNQHFKVMFEGVVGNRRGDICLDDITFSPGCLLSGNVIPDKPILPPAGSCPPGSMHCDNGGCYKLEEQCNFIDNCGDNSDEKDCGTSCSFEDGLCGWKTSHADNTDWMVGTGSAQGIRPPYDHTLMNENGHFVYMTATPLGLKGDRAHMRSSVWKESSASCKLAFWYYISSKATGVISLFIKTENELREIWMEQGMMHKWRRAEVPLRNLRNFVLVFELVRAKDVSGGAALDDLEFIDCAYNAIHPGACPTATDFVCNNNKCIDSSLVCDNKVDCADGTDELDCKGLVGSCNFNLPEDQWELACHLVQDKDDDFDWQIGHGRKYQRTGPSADHSPDGTGNYLYVNSAIQREGEVARITTQQEFPASTAVCHLRFWFHMYGSENMGALKVYTVGRSGVPLMMWAANGNYGDCWNYGNVVLSNTQPFKVSIQAEVGADKWTVVAIDDLSLTSECAIGGPVTPVTPTCDSGHFQCRYVLECVPQSWRCDGKGDCVDGSDEEGCGTLVPSTVSTPSGCVDGQYLCASGSCIPTLLLCDSIPDCPKGEDEKECPDVACKDGELVCESMSSCVPHNRRCDHNRDCPPFNSDESSCYECPVGYCLNGGVCIVGAHGPVCICKSSWTGNRCHVLRKPTRPTVSTVIPENKLVYIGISISVVLLGVAVGTVILFWLQKKYTSKDSRLIENEELDPSVCSWKGEVWVGSAVSDLRPRESAAFKTTRYKRHKPTISVYPWREEPEFPVRLFFSDPHYEGSSSEA